MKKIFLSKASKYPLKETLRLYLCRYLKINEIDTSICNECNYSTNLHKLESYDSQVTQGGKIANT